MGAYGIKPQCQQALAPVLALLLKWGVQPDALTYGAVSLGGLAGAALALAGHKRWLLLLAPPAILLRLGFNLLDGMLARQSGAAGPWGEVKNELGDRLADAAVLLGLGMGGYVSCHWLLLALVTSLLTPYIGLVSKAVGGPREYSGVMGKPDRMLVLSAASLYAAVTGDLSAFDIGLILIFLAGLVTMGQRMAKIYEHIQSAA